MKKNQPGKRLLRKKAWAETHKKSIAEREKELESCLWCKFARRMGAFGTRWYLTGLCSKNKKFGIQCPLFESLWNRKRSNGNPPSQWDRFKAGGDNSAPWPGYGHTADCAIKGICLWCDGTGKVRIYYEVNEPGFGIEDCSKCKGTGKDR